MNNLNHITQPSFKVVGETSKSFIMINERGIKIENGNKSLSPLGIVTIIPGIQIELGRAIGEFIQCLRLIRQPLAVQRIADNNGQSTWHIIRLATGKVPEALVCTINTLSGVMASVAFNHDLAYNMEYRKYQKLSVIHQLTAGKAGDSGLLSKAVSAVATITGEPVTSFNIKSNEKTIVVYTSIKSLEHQYKFTFVRDKKDYFNLLSVGFLAKKA